MSNIFLIFVASNKTNKVMVRIGYKAMNADMTCDGDGVPFIYELGKSYEIKGELEIFHNGFHFCKNIFNTLSHYDNIEGDNRFFKIQYSQCIDEFDISVTNKITILKEVNIFDFINDSMTYSDWNNISEYQKLSENLIRRFKNKVNWLRISRHQTLSEDFIREFQDYVDLDTIIVNQTLSEDFIIEFQDNVD